MNGLCPRRRLIALALAVVPLGSASGALAQFICDVDPWSQTANSGFGAGPGEVRGFAVTPQNVPDECLVEGVSYLNGVIVNVTQQGGSSTMPIDHVEILESSFNGPPTFTRLTYGPGGNIDNVPSFPAFVEERIPTAPATWTWDLDDDGTLDSFAAPTVFAEGDATPGQFFAYSTNGGPVPCHTGLEGAPINEPCTDGNPNFRSMGVGVAVAAGFATIEGIPPAPLFFRTNNPDADIGSVFDHEWGHEMDASAPDAIDVIRIFDEFGGVICSSPNVPPQSTRSCVLTPAQIQQFLDGKLEVEFDEDDNLVRFEIVPANMFIFADGFESGDTSAWSNTVP